MNLQLPRLSLLGPLAQRLLLCIIVAPQVNCSYSGVSITGDTGAGPAGLPQVIFGDDASAVGVAARGMGLEVMRTGNAQALFAPQVTTLPIVKLRGELNVNQLNENQVQQWALWDFDSFDSPVATPWSVNDHGFCGTPNDQFLGGHCRFANHSTSRRYEQLPPHSKVRVRARVHFIDEWKGESVILMAQGMPVWAESHDWCPGFLTWMCTKYGLDTCGRDTPDRLSVKAEATFAHSAQWLDVTFMSNLPHQTDPCYTSWGVDDVSVELL